MRYICVFFLLIGLLSCEKDIDFALDESAPVLVVNGEIEQGKPPRIVLTKSFGFFSELSADMLLNSFVRNAEVTLNNGTLTHRLKEYQVNLAPGVNFYYYGIDSANLSTAFLGELNRSYFLNIQAEGKTYQSTTSIPDLDWIPDSVFFKPQPLNPDTNARVMFIKATEPAGLGNYLRYFTQLNNQPFYPPFNSVFSDEIIDGTTYTVQADIGFDRNTEFEPGKSLISKGDTLTLKFCNIDRSTYKFWNTWEFASQSLGNPFSQPSKVIGNVSNGALGAFCGYAAWYNTYIIP
ncbi:MAG: hypothetical protein RIR96_1182 [Bacteroidota bacterium]